MDDLGRGENWREMAATTPIRRNGTDEDIGGFIAHLCTEASSWITGQSINLNGGTIMEH
jgi:NAD(P)-dependent dehydrogenase (short-subunit alcohol dehydrogenase family)